ncbi:MAG: aminopeptidase N [Micavibrio aeruginosavorus]|uniref:Aminopeptidase N n=1 Tax=Micavibrio aeruginosavorus TaxID=349221 RepID=A0A2W5FPF8_9BACT|nr:MAG: aminopeptidase N [Micavibrio aeruginosavorus]
MRTDTAPKTTYLKDYKVPDYKVRDIELTFRIFDDYTEVVSKAHYIKNHTGADDLVLNGEELILKSISIGGQPLDANEYSVDEKFLKIRCLGEEFILEITTHINPAANTSLEGLYKSEGNYCTQCESEGFRKITFFPDRPDVMSIFTTRIEAPKSLPVLLSNGNLIEEGELDSDRHFTVWNDPFPKPCYLFALVAGKLDHIRDEFTTMTGRKVDLYIYARSPDLPQCYWAMESLIRSMKWDEEVFGREYQLNRFNIVAVSDFNFGAMENTSLNIFNTALVLAEAETATDNDFLRVEGVVAHEYFHNWSGNRVTCRDWFQLSLKEGLTVFRDQEFTADVNSRAVKRIDDVVLLRARQFPEDAGPLSHPIRPDNYIEINNFYTLTVYEKGGEVIRMQKTLMGPEKFREGTDLYFNRFDGQAVTCDDFVQAMQEASGRDLSHFKLWYSQAGTPEIIASGHYDEKSKNYTLDLEQIIPATVGQPTKKAMHIPVTVGLISPNGDEIVSSTILELTKDKQQFTFENISAKPVPSILRNFSAPVKLTTDLSDDEYRFLMVHDTDGFNRWESGQIIAMRLILNLLKNESTDISPFIQSISALLDQCLDPKQDKALLARMLSLPDISIIGQECEIIDPDAIYNVLMHLNREILAQCRDRIQAVFDKVNTQKEYKPDPVSMGERALKRVVLKYLSANYDDHAVKLAKLVYDNANNMTDRMIGLSALMDTASAERGVALAHFHDKFKNYALVIDKWFSAQAMAVRINTLDDIKNLSKHPDFNIKNPNRVRSLYSTFSINNPVKFHARDGSGYNLLLKAVIDTDSINPHVSSRLLTAIRDWKRYTPDRQDKMKKILEIIIETKGLSPHAFEIASKTLNG